MARASGSLWKALLVPGCFAWQVAVHTVVSAPSAAGLRWVLLLLPLALFALWIARRARDKGRWIAAFAAACGAVLLLAQEGALGVALAYGAPHAVIYASLLFLFARTLVPGRVALITRLARRVHGTLPPYMQAYTRRITGAWCVFFTGQLVVSGLLFAFAALETWSTFVNLLNLPLIALMFGAEYLYRVTRYPDFPHATVAQTIGAFLSDAAAQTAGTR